VRVIGILLAAGAATRFGGGKLLAKLDDGTTVGARSCATLVLALREVIAVVRPGDVPLSHALTEAGARVTVCEESVHGMGASLAHGIALAVPCDAIVVALADMPWVSLSTIASLVTALEEGSPLVVPRYRSRRGNPVGFGRIHFNHLRSLHGELGARDLIDRAQNVRWIDVDDPAILRDVDTPADLRPRLTRAGH
jgi:molybdenum cofactor cytidylyltransferase